MTEAHLERGASFWVLQERRAECLCGSGESISCRGSEHLGAKLGTRKDEARLVGFPDALVRPLICVMTRPTLVPAHARTSVTPRSHQW